jgi:hypothetical protein
MYTNTYEGHALEPQKMGIKGRELLNLGKVFRVSTVHLQ